MQRSIAGESRYQQVVATVTAQWLKQSGEVSIRSRLVKQDNDLSFQTVFHLREESYINSNCDKDSNGDNRDKDSIIIIQIGPVFATIAMFSVDAFYYLLFAKPPRDALRLQRAQPPQASTDVIDTAFHQPLDKTHSV